MKAEKVVTSKALRLRVADLLDVCIDMCIDMCMDMRMDVCVGM